MPVFSDACAGWKDQTTIASAAFCIHVPTLLTRAPDQNSAKSRCRNDSKVLVAQPRLTKTGGGISVSASTVILS
jgi:hypothetical protein